MRDYAITTDSCADLPEEYLKEHGMGVAWLTCLLDGVAYNAENPLPIDVFYEKMRGGSMPTTSQVNPDQAKEMFEPFLKEGKDILHLAFSSALSGSCQSAVIAASDYENVYVVDSSSVASALPF